MIAIQNKNQLIENGGTPLNRKARKLTLESLEAALNAVDPHRIVKSRIHLGDSKLEIDSHTFDLDKYDHVYVVGGGKASGSMAEGLEEVLGNRISKGIVNVPEGNKTKTRIILLHEASHPMPNENGVKGTRRMIEIAEKAEKNDLIICLISGGGSSLMPLPRGDISISDKRLLTDALLKSGANINEINTIRKHISEFKGGWLAKKAYPATILNLILSDVVGDPLDFIASGPTVPDSTTFNDAVGILKKYDLWSKTPESIKEVLLEGERGIIPETPKSNDEVFKKVVNVVVGNSRVACFAATEHLKMAGLNTLLLTATMEGEARQVAVALSSIAHEVSASNNPVTKPAGIIAGGETTVTVTGKGRGGRNQEFALAAALKLKDSDGLVMASLSTDGIDGPTNAAGAIIDGKTIERAKKAGLSPEKFLASNDSFHFFSKLDDLICTGPTGTNVNDIAAIVVL